MELVFRGQTAESVLTTMIRSKHQNIFHLSPDDIDFINQPQMLPYQIAMLVESLRQGSDAFVRESILVNKPWPISLDDVRVPVHFWHGSDDKLVASDMILAFSQALPYAKFSPLEGETHLVTYRQLPLVLEQIKRSHSDLTASIAPDTEIPR
jgi:fermentation-respiration switch protein FrsA (DUF1100 family)